jgi:nucleolar MIF4G domain-containing protein 1
MLFIKKELRSNAASSHSFIGNKYGINMLLLILYFYNLRVLHHELIVDLLRDVTNLLMSKDKSSSLTQQEMYIELLVCIFENCGHQLMGDDPISSKEIMSEIVEGTRSLLIGSNKRMQYMAETINELKSNKSKRMQNSHSEKISKLRKWLGSIKTSLGAKPGDHCMHISLRDLLDAEKKGRWWRAGAAWIGHNTEDDASNLLVEKVTKTNTNTISSVTSEHQKLLELADKLRMNTQVRRDIFVVMMSSTDALDAYERLMRLDLNGKQDREIVRVLIECCAQEKAFNAFYSDLAIILCEQNRQHKSTFQFSFWDAFKTLDEDNFSDRRAINLARLLGTLVSAFHVSISILKVVDMSEISQRMVLFMATFFLSIFSSKVFFCNKCIIINTNL